MGPPALFVPPQVGTAGAWSPPRNRCDWLPYDRLQVRIEKLTSRLAGQLLSKASLLYLHKPDAVAGPLTQTLIADGSVTQPSCFLGFEKLCYSHLHGTSAPFSNPKRLHIRTLLVALWPRAIDGHETQHFPPIGVRQT
jgi:hypothetical protein